MKKKFLYVMVFIALIVSACGGSATQGAGMSENDGKMQASMVEFTGVIEAIDGDQWTINGQVLTVDANALQNASFVVGDTIKVRAQVQEDGSLVVTRVERRGDDNANDDGNGNANSNDNSNSNSNGNSNGNSNSNNNGSGGGNNNSNGNDNDDRGNDNDGGRDDNDNDDRGNNNDDDDDDDDNDNDD